MVKRKAEKVDIDVKPDIKFPPIVKRAPPKTPRVVPKTSGFAPATSTTSGSVSVGSTTSGSVPVTPTTSGCNFGQPASVKVEIGKVEIKPDNEGGNVTSNQPTFQVNVTLNQQQVNKPAYEGHVTIKVIGQDGSEVSFIVKRSAPLETLMNAYCDQREVTYKTFQYLYDGRYVKAWNTPGQLGMEKEVEIDAWLTQHGGAPV